MFFEFNNAGNCNHYYSPKGEQKQKEASKSKEKEQRLCLDKTLNNKIAGPAELFRLLQFWPDQFFLKVKQNSILAKGK